MTNTVTGRIGIEFNFNTINWVRIFHWNVRFFQGSTKKIALEWQLTLEFQGFRTYEY